MKRQFKACAQAKRKEIKVLKAKMMLTERKFEIADKNGTYWYNSFNEQVLQNKKCRDHNIELKAELMKVNKQLEHATEQKEFYKELNAMAGDNEKKYIDTLIKQNEVMTDLQFAYDVMKKKRDGLISLLLASVIIGAILYLW